MLTANDIKNATFSKSMSGYKQEDVDILLDKVEADYAHFERIIKEYELKVNTLNTELEALKSSQDSIQNVLLSAQKLADQIVNEAKLKSEEIINDAQTNISMITSREKELSEAFELKAQERKSALEVELNQMVETAEKKAQAITAAADESVQRQQALFDRLRVEIAAFKSGITAKYKEHLELLSKIPDTVPSDPKYIADILVRSFDEQPKVETFMPQEQSVSELQSSAEEEPESENNMGFKIESNSDEEDIFEEE